MPERAAEQFSSDVHCDICDGFFVVSCHPATSKGVSLLVMRIPLSVKDQVVREYVAPLGGKVPSSTSEKVKARSGLWKIKRNGDRRFGANFTGQI